MKIFWTLATTIAVLSHFSVINRDISYVYAAPIITAVRILYSTSIAWMILASAMGHGGFFAKILNFSTFVHVNKLSYAIYLLNPLVISVIYGAKDHSTHVEPLTMVSYTFSRCLRSRPLRMVIEILIFVHFVFFAGDYVGGRKCRLLFVVICVFDHVRSAVHKNIRSSVERRAIDGSAIIQNDGQFNSIR